MPERPTSNRAQQRRRTRHHRVFSLQIRSETRYAGAYTLRIDIYSDPAFTGRRLKFDVVVAASTADELRNLTLTASAMPESGTNASPCERISAPRGSHGAFRAT